MEDKKETEEQKLNMYYRLIRMVELSLLLYFLQSLTYSFPIEGLPGILWGGLPYFFLVTYVLELKEEKIPFEKAFWLVLIPPVTAIFAVLCVGHLHMSFL